MCGSRFLFLRANRIERLAALLAAVSLVPGCSCMDEYECQVLCKSSAGGGFEPRDMVTIRGESNANAAAVCAENASDSGTLNCVAYNCSCSIAPQQGSISGP